MLNFPSHGCDTKSGAKLRIKLQLAKQTDVIFHFRHIKLHFYAIDSKQIEIYVKTLHVRLNLNPHYVSK